MSETTQAQIDAMRGMCDTLDKQIVRQAHIDDWGRYGNFTLMVTPVEANRFTTQKLKALVRRAMPEGAHLRQCFPPDRGSGRTYWTFDVDFQLYHPDSNTFSKN